MVINHSTAHTYKVICSFLAYKLAKSLLKLYATMLEKRDFVAQIKNLVFHASG